MELKQLQRVTMVLPTYKEPGIGSLLTEIISVWEEAEEFSDIPIVLIVVDDSPPGDVTTAIIREFVDAYMDDPLVTIKLIRGLEKNTLGEAIFLGLEEALQGATSNELILVGSMDSDGQHPPSMIPVMVREIVDNNYNFVSPSRYTIEGGASGLDGPLRQLLSGTLRQLPRILFPRKIGRVSDVLGNFFMCEASLIDLNKIKPISARLQMEILATNRRQDLRVKVRGFTFRERLEGESKMGAKEAFRFFYHLLNLRWRTRFIP